MAHVPGGNAELGQPSEQLLARGLDETSAGEARVVGHLCHAFGRGHEGPRLLISGELGLGKHQSLQVAVEDINAQGRRAETSLGQLTGGQEASRSYSAGDKYVLVIKP